LPLTVIDVGTSGLERELELLVRGQGGAGIEGGAGEGGAGIEGGEGGAGGER
jgi:hypothetical protein